MNRLGSSSVLLSLAVVSAGCEDSSTPERTFTVRDSSGVEIVESSAPLLGPDAWVIPEDPVLQIGETVGDDSYLFQRIPLRLEVGLGGIMRLDDGRIAVADRGGQRVRFFDPEGKFVSQFGGEGGGPGEFPSNIAWMTQVGERIAVAVRGRISYFGLEGQYLDGVNQTTPGFFSTNGIFPDGSMLIRISDPSLSPDNEGMIQVRQGTVVVVGPDGRRSDWSVVINTGTLVPMEFEGRSVFTVQPFGPDDIQLVMGDEWVYGWSSEYALQIYDRSGSLKRIIRRLWDPVAVSNADRDENSLSGRTPADHYPPFDHGIIDKVGHLWLLPGKPDAELDVFDPNGTWLTTIRLPPNLEVHEIGEDYVLGVWKDEMDVSYVRMYSLDRSG